ncbi:uncharacterized protein PSFLO_06069 [Pseudozyma flocculosa]|uniref:Uncharacterized protein n=1 Tax=Pseudozyma flocculosa TaxID=84751 RepID=A0A5C3FA16_9BASI|nr:uncharacterized protein PSFLO_06069 [Pseudozyma flocculosa]
MYRPALVWSGLVCSGLVWSGLVWSGPARISLEAKVPSRIDINAHQQAAAPFASELSHTMPYHAMPRHATPRGVYGLRYRLVCLTCQVCLCPDSHPDEEGRKHAVCTCVRYGAAAGGGGRGGSGCGSSIPSRSWYGTHQSAPLAVQYTPPFRFRFRSEEDGATDLRTTYSTLHPASFRTIDVDAARCRLIATPGHIVACPRFATVPYPSYVRTAPHLHLPGPV